ncbi:MAG: ABC-F family ATP-binding cassette domain-containing protein, partial [Phycisphaerae bacterium]|nr:ABC-F family ATP-binding cassette domain-containing protein [Phycisphaerae bacterium]
VLDEIRGARPDLSEQEARSYLGRFLFSGDDVFKRLADCSGGEQSRVRLARLILSNPQVLILDEPTNHLDIPSREALESALDDYEGTIIVVSHDRFFLDQVVDRLLVMERGRHRVFLGNYSEYARQVEAEQAEAEAARIAAAAAVRKHETKRKRAKGVSNPYDGLSMEQIEDLLIGKEQELAGLMEQFATEAVYRDPAATRALQEQCEALKTEIAAIDAAWQERAEEMG